MSIFAQLASFALRPLMRAAISAIPTEVGKSYAESLANAAENYLISRFTDPSKQLQEALNRATKRSWLAIEIALRGSLQIDLRRIIRA
jgi:hypothetical protein